MLVLMNVQIVKYYHFAIFRGMHKYVPLKDQSLFTILWFIIWQGESTKVFNDEEEGRGNRNHHQNNNSNNNDNRRRDQGERDHTPDIIMHGKGGNSSLVSSGVYTTDVLKSETRMWESYFLLCFIVFYCFIAYWFETPFA
jgi:hypothetical protein